LLYSKFQKHDQIRSIGEAVGKKIGVPFYYRDFRDGWKEGIEESKKLEMYRQQYCGCIYSEKDRYFRKPEKNPGHKRLPLPPRFPNEFIHTGRMFANFIYFIVALLIYSTYQPIGSNQFQSQGDDHPFLCTGRPLLLHLSPRQQFKRLKKDRKPTAKVNWISNFPLPRPNNPFWPSFVCCRHLRAEHLFFFWQHQSCFKRSQRWKPLFFMVLFIGYLSIVWYNAHGAYRLSMDRIWSERRTYVPTSP
jgi:hypothetical protein